MLRSQFVSVDLLHSLTSLIKSCSFSSIISIVCNLVAQTVAHYSETKQGVNADAVSPVSDAPNFVVFVLRNHVSRNSLSAMMVYQKPVIYTSKLE